MSEKLAASKESGAHHQLGRLEGEWEGTGRVWFEADAPPVDESPVQGTFRSLMDGKFLIYEYESAFQGKPLSGLAIFAYNLTLNRFESAWIDSFHTGTAIMFSEGARQGSDFNMQGAYYYNAPDGEQRWGWRTTLEQRSDNEVVITAYNVTPGGEEQKATEAVLKKSA